LLVGALRQAGVPASAYGIAFATQRELPRMLSACDASISFRGGKYSKMAASPTKLGECLAAGLPTVSNAGIGDCDSILETNRLGVVIHEFCAEEYDRATKKLCDLLADLEAPTRCRRFAAEELSLSTVGGFRYLRLYRRLLEK
jgi:hypothetical protein